MTAQQAHEQQLASITQDKHKKKLQIAVGIVAFVLVAGGIGGGVLFKQSQEEAEKQKAALEAERARLAEEKSRLEGMVKKAEEKEADLQAALNSAKDEAERARIQAELKKAQENAANARKCIRNMPAAAAGATKPASKPKPACNCPPGDPLCSCF